jgi:hypothetical protein
MHQELTMQTTLSASLVSIPVSTAVGAGAAARWGGRILTAIPVLFMIFDAAIKLPNPQFVIEASEKAGWPANTNPMLGALVLALLALYLVPRTAVLGAVLLTGYLGGAVAVHVRLADPLLTHTLFPIYVGALFWAGLYLRDQRVRRAIAAR